MRKRYSVSTKRYDDSGRNTRGRFWRKESYLTRMESMDRLPAIKTETITDTISRRGYVIGRKLG